MASKAETFQTNRKFGKIGKLQNMTKNCEKSQVTRNIFKLAIFAISQIMLNMQLGLV